jgi:hypothetical protein
LGPSSPTTPAAQENEHTPLLAGSRRPDNSLHSTPNSIAHDQDLEIGLSGTAPTFPHNTKQLFSSVLGLSPFGSGSFHLVKAKMKHEVSVNVPHYLMQAVSAVPAVLLGCLLNILDGVSCEFVISVSFQVFFPRLKDALEGKTRKFFVTPYFL